jgi:APA family basic amino acid/polyamine antiporter
MDDKQRLYPKWLTWLSFCFSLLLAFCVEWQYWLIGLALIRVGLIWHFTIRQVVLKSN